MNAVFMNLKVFPDKMKKNLEITKGLPMAESLMTTLISKGVGRGDAHEIMRKIALKAASENKSLKEVFIEKNKKRKILSDKEIDYSIKPENYLGATDKIIDRVVKRLER
jgi:adenylosuccinate lyase